METDFIDKSGKSVKPGDLIVYGVAYGRAAGLSYGKAFGSHTIKKKIYDQATSEWYEVDYPHLTVWGVDRHWNGEAKSNARKSTLQFQERVLVVDRSQIPADLLAELDKIEVDT